MRLIGRRIRIFGAVQGVFFRGWTVQQAGMLDVKGWVRNRGDGSVEVEAWGEAIEVDRLIERCREGPPSAQVDRVEVEETKSEAPAGFSVAPTL
jgi:acylphosphatase